MTDRRKFLALSAATAAALPQAIREALAVPANRVSGSIRDVEHVVILMQENRAFDHYFGTLRGVRGFGDPRALTLPSGQSVFHQPRGDGSVVTPFRLDTKTTSAQFMKSLDHSWKGTQARWQHHDAWIGAKTEMTMGHFVREDIPFYHALADAFTICDAYHCSIFGPTSPNRMFLFSGTNGLAVGEDGPDAVINTSVEVSESADQAHDTPAFAAYKWMTYAERLQAAGIDWRLYQEFDNYGDNELAYFANFRGIDPASELYKRGRAWVDGSNAANAKTSRGEHLVAAFAKDVAADTLPQVSYIVAPYIICEHPAAPPGYGESFTARMIAALAANPKVWAKTVFILTYDENDGFFDHVPPLVPPSGTGTGISTVETKGEFYHGEPVGFGPRVPAIVVSPWTRGGWVNSQLFDHTSIIRFLETRFGVMEPQITPWRRAMAGDLTSVFDFAGADEDVALPAAGDRLAATDATQALAPPLVPAALQTWRQEPGQRPARPLPYALEVNGHFGADGGFVLDIVNRGTAGAGLVAYGRTGAPRYYAVEAGKQVRDTLPAGHAGHDITLHGPNGFLRHYRGGTDGLEIGTRYDAAADALVIAIRNGGKGKVSLHVKANAYGLSARTHVLEAGAVLEDPWPLAASDHWYDVSVTLAEDRHFLRRLAGHVETGRPSKSDPAMGAA